MHQIFGQRFIIFEKLRYRGQLFLKIQAVEVANEFHLILYTIMDITIESTFSREIENYQKS